MEQRKKFGETKVGKFIKRKAPDVLDAIGDSFPPVKIVKTLLQGKINDHAELEQFEDALRQYELELKDLDSARQREIAIVTSDAAPILNKIIVPILALVIVALTFTLFYLIMFKRIESVEKDIIIYVLGALTTYVGQVLSYYFGSSRGSANKDATIRDILKK
jgi:hypothetical protein